MDSKRGPFLKGSRVVRGVGYHARTRTACWWYDKTNFNNKNPSPSVDFRANGGEWVVDKGALNEARSLKNSTQDKVIRSITGRERNT